MTEALRRKLTNAGRVLTSQDQGDFVAGHVTVRLPDDPGHALWKRDYLGATGLFGVELVDTERRALLAEQLGHRLDVRGGHDVG